MVTLEEQIQKTEKRLARLREKEEERAARTAEAAERGPSARVMNQLARDVRAIDRVVKICRTRFDGDEQLPAAVGALEGYQDSLIRDYGSGLKQKREFCSTTGDNSELDKLQEVEKFVDEFGVEM